MALKILLKNDNKNIYLPSIFKQTKLATRLPAYQIIRWVFATWPPKNKNSKHLNWLPGYLATLPFIKIPTNSKNVIKPELATRLLSYPLIKIFTNITTAYLDTPLPYHFFKNWHNQTILKKPKLDQWPNFLVFSRF